MKYVESKLGDIAFKILFATIGATFGTFATIFNEWLLQVRSDHEGQPLVALTGIMIFVAFTLFGARNNHIKGWAKHLGGTERAITAFYFVFGTMIGIIAVGLAYLPNTGLGLGVKLMALPLAAISYYFIRIVTAPPAKRILIKAK